MKRLVKTSLGLVAASTIVGCASLSQPPERKAIASETVQARNLLKSGKQLSAAPSSLSYKDEAWVGSTKLELTERDRLPRFFGEKLIFSQLSPTSFINLTGIVSGEIGRKLVITNDAMDFIGEGGDTDGGNDSEADSSSDEIMSSLSSDFEQSVDFMMTVDYSGSVAGLLDYVTSKVELSWRWENNQIEIFRNRTQTFIVDIINAETTFEASMSSSMDGTGGDDETSSSALSTHKTTVSSRPKSPLSGMEETINSMLSRSGSIVVTGGSGIVSVTDTPEVLKKVGVFIKKMNAIASKQIGIKTEIYDVTINSDDNHGIDWSALYNGSGRFDLKLNTGGTASVNSFIEMGIINPGSKFSGSKGFISALSTVADVSLVTSSYSYALNGQPSPIQVVDEVGYLASIAVEINSETGASTTSLEPGITTSGLSMTVTPKVTSTGDIIMQVAMDLSNLKQINEFGSEDTKIQLPERSVKNFLQKALMKNGKTLMIAGFERTENRYSTSGPISDEKWWLGGTRSKGEKKITTVVLMTPYIISK